MLVTISTTMVSEVFDEFMQGQLCLLMKKGGGGVVKMGTTGKKDTHTASLYELAFTVTRSVSGQCCEVKQQRARLVAGWVTQA